MLLVLLTVAVNRHDDQHREAGTRDGASCCDDCRDSRLCEAGTSTDHTQDDVNVTSINVVGICVCRRGQSVRWSWYDVID